MGADRVATPNTDQTAGPAAPGREPDAPGARAPGPARLLALQRTAGNAAVSRLVARRTAAVQRKPVPAPPGSAVPAPRAVRISDWSNLKPLSDDPLDVIGNTVELFQAIDGIRPDPDFVGDPKVFHPVVALVFFEDYVVALDRRARPVAVVPQGEPHRMTADGIVVINESSSGRIWVMQMNSEGRVRAERYYNVGTQPVEGVDPGVSQVFIYAPARLLTEKLATSMERRAKGRSGTADEAPPWAHQQFSRLTKRRGAAAGGPGGPRGHEGGKGTGNVDKGGVGGGGKADDPGAVVGGDGQAKVEGATAGSGSAGQPTPPTPPATPGVPKPPGGGPPRPLQGPASFRLQTRPDGTPQLRIAVDQAVTTTDLRPGETDAALDKRIAKAIDDLQASRDPANSTAVKDGAKETGFVPPKRGVAGKSVDPKQAADQAKATPSGLSPGERVPGGKGGANAQQYPSRLTFEGDDLPFAVSTLGATNSLAMILDYAARSFGTQDEVWNRLQTITFYWELIDVTNVAVDKRKQKERETKIGEGDYISAGSGDARNIGRTLDDIAEDQENDLRMMEEEDWNWSARASYLAVIGLSNAVRTIGSIISSFVAAVTRPLNERAMAFDREGEFLVRCVATPQVSDEAREDPDHHVIRASSVSVIPVKVMKVRDRAKEAVTAEDRKLAELEAAVANAKDDKARELAQKTLELYRRGLGQGGLANYRTMLSSIRAQLQVARAVRGHVERQEPERTWTTEELYLQIALLRDGERIDQRVRKLERQLKATAGEGAEREGATKGEHEEWVASQAGKFDAGREYRPRVVLASEVTGQVTPIQCMLGRLPDRGDGRTRWRLVDITSPGSRDTFDAESAQAGDAGHQEAIRTTFRKLAEAGQYDRGTIAIRLPADLRATFPGVTIEPDMRSRPGGGARALQRLKDLATVAEIAGLFATGGVGVALGAVGGVAGAVVAVESLVRRGRTGHLLEVSTIFDVLGVIGGAASVMGVGTAMARSHLETLGQAGTGTPAWVSKLERTEKALHIHGTIGNVQQIIVIPYQLMTELQAIEEQGGEEGQRSARRALSLLNALRSGAVTVIQAGGGLGQHDQAVPKGTRDLPEGTGARQAGEHADGQGPARPPTTTGDPVPTTGEGPTVRPAQTGEPPRGADGGTAPRTPSPDQVVAKAKELAQQRRQEADAATRRAEGVREPTAPAGGPEPGAGGAGAAGAGGTEPVSSGAARLEGLASLAGRIGADPGEALQRIRPEATTKASAADAGAVRLLADAGSFGTLRKDVELSTSLSGPQSAALQARLQEARLAVTNEHVADVLATIRERHPDLQFTVQDLGTVGFNSDRDITIRVTPHDAEAYAAMSDADRAAIDRRAVQASAETVPELYRALEAAGFPANASLDTNFYTELHEGRIKPSGPAEATQIAADQQIVAMSEVIVHAGEGAWKDYVAHQRAEIDGLVQKGTPEPDVRALRDRLDQQVAAAEASVRRLLGELPQGGHGDPTRRDSALGAARERLVDALRRQPPAGARELRQLMADIKLLEPDAYGTRAAVTDVVLGGQAMRGATLENVKADGFRTRRQIDANVGEPGPRRFDERTGRMDEVSAEDEVARRRNEAHAHVGQRRPGDGGASAYEVNAARLQVAEAVLGHLLGHVPEPGHATVGDARAAAKNLARIVDAAEGVAGARPTDPTLARLPDVVAAKSEADAATATNRELQAWAAEPTVRDWAARRGVPMADGPARAEAFVAWAKDQAFATVARMRVQAETAAVHGDVAVGTGGSGGAGGAVAPPRPGPTPPPAGGPPPPAPGPAPARPTPTGDEAPAGGGTDGTARGRADEPMTATGPRVGPRPAPDPGDVGEIANPEQYTQAVRLLDARMGERTPTQATSLAPSGRFGPATHDAAAAVRSYDDAIAAAGNREVGLWFNMNTGEFQVNIGLAGSVGAPGHDPGWVNLQHIHPGIGEARRFRLPAPQDFNGWLRAAVRLGTFTTFIESYREGGSRGRVRITVSMADPHITIEIPQDGPRPPQTLTFADEAAYAEYWGGQTVYAEPGSPLYDDLTQGVPGGWPARGGAGSGPSGPGGMTATGPGQGQGPGQGSSAPVPKRTGPAPGGAIGTMGTASGRYGSSTSPLELTRPLDRSDATKVGHGGWRGSAQGSRVGVFRGELAEVGPVVVKVDRVGKRAQMADELAGAEAAARSGYGPSVYGWVAITGPDGQPDPKHVGFAMGILGGQFLEVAGSDRRDAAETRRLEGLRDRAIAGLGDHTLAQLDDYARRLVQEGFVYTGELQAMYDDHGNLLPVDFQGLARLPADPTEQAEALAHHQSEVAAEKAFVRKRIANPQPATTP